MTYNSTKFWIIANLEKLKVLNYNVEEVDGEQEVISSNLQFLLMSLNK